MSEVTPGSCQPSWARASSGPLTSCAALGTVSIGQPGGQRLVVVGQLGDVEPACLAVGRRRPSPCSGCPCRDPRCPPTTARPGGRRVACAARKSATVPGPNRVTRPRSPRQLRARGWAGSRTAARAAPGTAGCRTADGPLRGPRADGQFADPDLELHVADQPGQLRVAQHRPEVLAQRVTHLALDLVDPGHQFVQRAELADPLRGGLLPHARDAGQVVARVAAQGGEVGVLGGRQPVLVSASSGVNRVRSETPLRLVQRGDLVGDQLQRVPVAGQISTSMPCAARPRWSAWR